MLFSKSILRNGEYKFGTCTLDTPSDLLEVSDLLLDYTDKKKTSPLITYFVQHVHFY